MMPQVSRLKSAYASRMCWRGLGRNALSRILCVRVFLLREASPRVVQRIVDSMYCLLEFLSYTVK